VISHCALICISPMNSDGEHFCMCCWSPCVFKISYYSVPETKRRMCSKNNYSLFSSAKNQTRWPVSYCSTQIHSSLGQQMTCKVHSRSQCSQRQGQSYFFCWGDGYCFCLPSMHSSSCEHLAFPLGKYSSPYSQDSDKATFSPASEVGRWGGPAYQHI
jgi:hypothetical protein